MSVSGETCNIHPPKMKPSLRVDPRKYLTLEYWRLETGHEGWANADIDVVPAETRRWKTYVDSRDSQHISRPGQDQGR